VQGHHVPAGVQGQRPCVFIPLPVPLRHKPLPVPLIHPVEVRRFQFGQRVARPDDGFGHGLAILGDGVDAGGEWGAVLAQGHDQGVGGGLAQGGGVDEVHVAADGHGDAVDGGCLLYTSPSPPDH
jgi:hypothetical protein